MLLSGVKVLRNIFKFSIILIIFIINSCGYSIQTRADLPFKELYLRNVENLTLEPGLQDRFRKIAYQSLSENGFTLTSNAEKVLDLKIKNYRLLTLSEIGLTAVEYEIQIEVQAILYDKNGEKLMEFNPASPFRTVFRTTRELQRVIADRDIATESLIRDICDDLARKLIFHDTTPKI